MQTMFWLYYSSYMATSSPDQSPKKEKYKFTTVSIIMEVKMQQINLIFIYIYILKKKNNLRFSLGAYDML